MKQKTNKSRSSGARHWAAPFVLLMLCLRAFVPAGFMLVPVDGRLDVVLCDSDAQKGATHHHSPDHPAHHHTKTDPACPYAQSSGPAPLPTLPALAAASIVTLPVLPTQHAQTIAQFGPTRQQSPRGPPLLA
jgi:hypothetical protein